MSPLPRPIFTRLLLGLVLLAPGARAQTVPPDQGTAAPGRPFFSRISGLFRGELPELEIPDTINVILRPHVGDFVRRDYLRVEAGLRWALSNHFEVRSEAAAFFAHGSGGSVGSGIGKIQFGAKYVFERWPGPDSETSVNLNVETPVGQPPIDLTDGHNHFSPSFVVQHHWPKYPRLLTFAGMGLDFIRESRVPGTFWINEPHDNSVSFTGGGVYDVGQIKWTFSATYATTSVLSNRPEQFFSLQPGLLWYVPSRFTFHSKTQWIAGLTANAGWGPDGSHFSLGSRLRAEITFLQVMNKLRGRREVPPDASP